ncbi:MAG: GIY-YIG nuclease family protein [Tumebacillaceae bacterium]
MNRKAELKFEYKQTHRPMGVFQIKNNVNGKIFLVGARNIDGIINSQMFQLKMNGHRNVQLQREYNEYGADAFSCEVLEQIKPSDDPGRDYLKEVKALEEKWHEKLQPYGERGYHKQ